jgi:hypothetical protein
VLLLLSTIRTGVWLLATAPADPAALSSLTAVAAIALLTALTAVALVRAAAGVHASAHAPAVVAARHTHRVPIVTRLCDPDAAGRPRPRAPGLEPAV